MAAGNFSDYAQFVTYLCFESSLTSQYPSILPALPLASLSVVQTSSPPSIGPPLSHRPSSVLFFFFAPVVFHRRRTEHLSALNGSANTREACCFFFLSFFFFAPAVIVVCVGKHACVSVCTRLIHSISGIPWHHCPLVARRRPLKGRISNRFLSDGLFQRRKLFSCKS